MTAAAQPAGRRWRGSPLAPSWQKGYLFASPALIVMIAILIYPLIYSFVMSFYRWDLSSPSQYFVGLSNYRDTFNSLGFKQTLRVQLIFSAVTIVVEVAAGMGVAVLVNGRLRGLKLARTLLLVPPMIAPAVVGLNFRWLFNGQYGLVNGILRFLGLPEAPWLSDPDWALASVMIADIWQNTPLLVLLFLAGLQSLPQEPIEAAQVDGASSWGIFWHITLPLMRPILMIALMLRIIDTFRTFDVVWLMTQGGPGGATSLITVNAYQSAFQSASFGHASAVSYVALAMSLLFLALLYGAPWAARKMRRNS